MIRVRFPLEFNAFTYVLISFGKLWIHLPTHDIGKITGQIGPYTHVCCPEERNWSLYFESQQKLMDSSGLSTMVRGHTRMGHTSRSYVHLWFRTTHPRVYHPWHFKRQDEIYYVDAVSLNSSFQERNPTSSYKDLSLYDTRQQNLSIQCESKSYGKICRMQWTILKIKLRSLISQIRPRRNFLRFAVYVKTRIL